MSKASDFGSVNKKQTKYLSAPTAAGSGFAASLQFNNLVVGEKYEVKGHVITTTPSATGENRFQWQIINSATVGTNVVIAGLQGNATSLSNVLNGYSVVGEFTAVETVMNFEITSNPGGRTTPEGDGSVQQTHVTLKRVENTEVETTEWT